MTLTGRRSLLAAVFGGLALASAGHALEVDGDMTLGDPAAKVTVVEYASASCSHCAAFHTEVFPAFKSKYLDTGKARYVLREVLTEPADFAAAGFLTARCAGPDRYFEVLGELFAGFPQLARTGDARQTLLRAAAAGGLGEPQVLACISDPAAVAALRTRVSAAQREGAIAATPTFYVNGKKVSEGPMTLAELDAAIGAAAMAN